MPLLAYPYGFHTAHVRRAAAAAGYEYALSLPQGPEPSGPLAVPRVGIYRDNCVTGLRVKTRARSTSRADASRYGRPPATLAGRSSG